MKFEDIKGFFWLTEPEQKKVREWVSTHLDQFEGTEIIEFGKFNTTLAVKVADEVSTWIMEIPR